MKKFAATLVAWGPAGMFLAALLDGAGVTLPGGVDVLLVVLATRLPDQIYWLATLAIVGSLAGNLILYAIARRGGKMFLDKRARGKNAQRFRHWFDRYGLLTVFTSALVPLPVMPMKIFVLCAGAMGSNLRAFVLSFLGGRIPRYIGLALLGRAMGEDAMGYLRSHVWHLTAFAVGLFLFLMLLVKMADRRRGRSPMVNVQPE
jgi:membrane protein YqaA with SNARE-associated domain